VCDFNLEKYEQAKSILAKYGQEHLLTNYEGLTEQKKEELVEQILRINFEEIGELYELAKKNVATDNVIEPTPYIEKAKLSNEELEKYRKIGEAELRKGNYAVVTMAGGQRNKIRA
jgi:UDP-N-acetylglucosamine pyrophosphorylase